MQALVDNSTLQEIRLCNQVSILIMTLIYVNLLLIFLYSTIKVVIELKMK